ncbi:translation initiation factor IF-3 [Marispirochaeta sp.]|uniref:translation initiation factor IF-3 n=1 Tax=Marispirochaeta sp. TaxID=2038653 RepID=UPI0029C88B7E|nr:translation initiation factor IF-3 [Marispirochaeta sp.]
MAVKDLRINEQIRVREVRLIDGDGEQRGVLPVTEAIQLAQDAGLDLVEIAPNANPPVCKILDYGKYKFEQEKRNRESKKKQKLLKMKEIRMQPKIEKHDMEFKAKHIRTFLEEGNKVKVTVRFRGRELAHTELGRVVLEKILELLGDSFIVDRPPAMEGRFMSMILNPKVSNKSKQKQSKESDSKEETADAKDENA